MPIASYDEQWIDERDGKPVCGLGTEFWEAAEGDTFMDDGGDIWIVRNGRWEKVPEERATETWSHAISDAYKNLLEVLEEANQEYGEASL